ncbi:MAG: ATP-binding cassette domain-containing protein, partial [Candidatus Limnocylindrales bacterium]
SVLESLERATIDAGRIVLSVEGVSASNDRGLPALRDASLQVRAGEIVGIAAVAGNGQSELAQVITGLRTCTGRVIVDGRDIAAQPPRVAIASGVAHVPEDRAGVGSAPNLSLVDNLILRRFRSAPVARGPFLDQAAARDKAQELQISYAISAPNLETPVRILSGGNLQRLILAREIDSAPTLLVAVQPTRGLDVGAIEGIHQLLLDLRAGGAAILLISEELDELLALADRLLVMYEGRVTAAFETPSADDVDDIGLHMTGGLGPLPAPHAAGSARADGTPGAGGPP